MTTRWRAAPAHCTRLPWTRCRRACARGRDWRWAAAPALALALAFWLPRMGTQAPVADDPAQVAAAAAAAAEAPVVPLEQDPEFYAWLASADALALASE